MSAGRLQDQLLRWAVRTPSAPALTCAGRTTSWAELAARTDLVAAGLLARGVRRGDRVAVRSRPTDDGLVAYLAAASIGAVFEGLNPALTGVEVTALVRDAAPALVVDLDDGVAAGVAAAEGVPHVQQLPVSTAEAAIGLGAARAAVAPSDPALLVHTSGSTGRQKGALVPHAALVHAGEVHADRWSVDQGTTTLLPFPLGHVAALSDIFGTALAGGARTVVVPDFDPDEVARLLDEERVTLWGVIPAAALLVTATETWRRASLASVRRVVWGGGAAPTHLIGELRTRGLAYSSCYGSTETVGNVCFADCEQDDDELLATTIGRPDRRYRVELLDEAGAPVAPGQVGELCVAAEHAFTGYWDDPAATARCLDAAGWLHTGDLAVRRPDGALVLVGRVHEMFKSGGYNVYPREVELALEALPGVRAAAVVAVDDGLYGQVGHAFVVSDPTSGTVDADALRSALRGSLAGYKVPKQVTVLEALPLLAVGKVDKAALAAGLGAVR